MEKLTLRPCLLGWALTGRSGRSGRRDPAGRCGDSEVLLREVPAASS